jgi:hypothetical protein
MKRPKPSFEEKGNSPKHLSPISKPAAKIPFKPALLNSSRLQQKPKRNRTVPWSE